MSTRTSALTPPTCDLPRRTVLICGPPCSGKTTLAHWLAGPGDLVIDFDDMARQLGSPDRWIHAEPYRSQAEQRMRETLARLPGTAPGTAYVIRSAPTARQRAITARQIRAADVIVLNPGSIECRRRAARESRPPVTDQSIEDWYRTYRPWSGDNAT